MSIDDYYTLIIKNESKLKKHIKKTCETKVKGKVVGKETLHDLYADVTIRIAEKLLESSVSFESELKLFNYIRLACLNNYVDSFRRESIRKNHEQNYTALVSDDVESTHTLDLPEFEERYLLMVEHIQRNYPPIFEGIFKLSVIGKPVTTKTGVIRKSYTATEIGVLYGKSKAEILYKLKKLKTDLAKEFKDFLSQKTA